MDFSDQITKLADRLRERKPHVRSEEATKQSLVIPFIRDLGYDIYNPAEVVPEYIADVGMKKGEKVDYAILKDGSPILLIECKDVSVALGPDQRSQLTRYFLVTPEARYAVLTNGIVYQFFTELDEKNQMDATPFLTIDMENLNGRHVRELERFTKDAFDADRIFSAARELRFMREIGERIAKEFRDPSEDLVRHFARQVYGKPLTKPRMAEFTRFVREALRAHVNDLVRNRLQSAMQTEPEVPPLVVEPNGESQSEAERKKRQREAGIKAADTRLRNQASRQSSEEPDYSKYQNWEQLKADPELYNLFMQLCEYGRSLGDDVLVNPTKYYISFWRKRTVAYVRARTGIRRLIVYVYADLKQTQLNEGFTRILPDSINHPPCNVEIRISNQADLERAKPLIQRSIDAAG